MYTVQPYYAKDEYNLDRSVNPFRHAFVPWFIELLLMLRSPGKKRKLYRCNSCQTDLSYDEASVHRRAT